MATLASFNLASIVNKFRLSYFVFAVLLCTTFVSIFMYAEISMEKELVKGRLLQQLELSQEKYGEQPIFTADPGIKIYHFNVAPTDLQKVATGNVQEMPVTINSKTGKIETNLHFFFYKEKEQAYILTYLEDSAIVMENYPVLAIFENFGDLFFNALLIAVSLSLLIAAVFSHLSSKQITKPLLDLKQAVETDDKNLAELTNLPSEVGVLARAIDERNHKLEQYLKREQLFTGDVSHELRTPLTIILGASEVLAAQLAHDNYLSQFINRISDTAKETSEIVSALLLLSRNPEQLDNPITSINDIANNEVARLNYLLKYKSVTCTIVAEKSYTVNVRPELLKMALGNLIKNAFQYTDEGEVIITIDSTKITISDTGLGIPEIMMPLLYERFERLPQNNTYIKHSDDYQHDVELQRQSNNKVESTGLGLSIVQRIMTHMGWELTHQANEANGSTFSIRYH